MKHRIEIEKNKRERSKEITIQHKATREEKVFESIDEASEFFGFSKYYLAGMISGKRKNTTRYIFTTD